METLFSQLGGVRKREKRGKGREAREERGKERREEREDHEAPHSESFKVLYFVKPGS